MTKKYKATPLISVVSGLMIYTVIGKLGLYLLEIGWANYSIHNIDKSYTLGMFLARQFVGVLASIATGISTAKIANDKGRTIWIVALIVFLGAAYVHFMTKTWNDYAVWYHFLYVFLILPVILLSGKIATKSNTSE